MQDVVVTTVFLCFWKPDLDSRRICHHILQTPYTPSFSAKTRGPEVLAPDYFGCGLKSRDGSLSWAVRS